MGKRPAVQRHQRIALDAPRAADEILAFAGARGRGRLRPGDGTAAAKHLQLAQDVTVACAFGTRHPHPHVARGRGPAQRIVVGAGRKRQERPPLHPVVRCLDLAPGGAPDPVQGHAIEGAGRTQVDLDPLGAAAGALPRADEIMGTAEVDPAAAGKCVQAGNAPAGHRGGVEPGAVESRRPAGGNVEGRLDQTRPPGRIGGQDLRGARATELPPGPAVVRSLDGAGPALRVLVLRAHHGDHVDAVDPGCVVAPGLFDLHPPAGGGQIDGRARVGVDQVFPLVPGEDAFRA